MPSESLFQFRYMNVPMVRRTTDENENVTVEDFTLNRLEVIGRINPEGLNIKVCKSMANGQNDI